MKKKIFGGLFILAIAAVAAFNINMNRQDNRQSFLSLANVEALAGESENKDENDWYVTKCTTTVYQYDERGRVSKTTTYEHPCCVDGSSPCTI